MNQFLKFLFASCLGTALCLVLLFFIGSGWITGLIAKASAKETVSVEPNAVMTLDFKNAIPEKTNNTVMPADFNQKDVLGLTDMVTAIRRAKDDPKIKGIYLNSSFFMGGKATSATLREALLDFKSSRKFIVSYADYYTQGAYYLSSVSDSILLNPVGLVDFRGYSSMIAYYKGLLDKMDVQMRIFYAGQFKSATEPYRLDKMSDQNRLQVREYMGALYEIFIRDIAKSRNIPEPELRQIADRYDGRSPDGSIKSRLVDRLAYEDEAFVAMKKMIGLDEKDKLHRISIEDYFDATGKRKTDFSIKDKIAVVYAEGNINGGKDGEPGEIFDGKYVKMLREIRNNRDVKALVLRINSPGGSSLASENILREVSLIRQSGRPVVVSMGDVAASGGYYIACASDSIFAEAATITGSIGVFGMIPMLDKTMKNKLGITYDTVRTGKYSAFGSPFIDFSPEESQLIQNSVDKIYEDFLQRVSKARSKTRDEVHAIAQGRVWAGLKAKEIGLVDDIGGLDRALSAAAKLAGLEKYRTDEYPRTKSGIEQFIDRFAKPEERDGDVKTWMMRNDMGDLYPLYKSIRDMKRNQGIQMRLPYEVMVQ